MTSHFTVLKKVGKDEYDVRLGFPIYEPSFSTGSVPVSMAVAESDREKYEWAQHVTGDASDSKNSQHLIAKAIEQQKAHQADLKNNEYLKKQFGEIYYSDEFGFSQLKSNSKLEY